MAWEEAEESAANREDWRRSVAHVSTTRDDLSLSKSVPVVLTVG